MNNPTENFELLDVAGRIEQISAKLLENDPMLPIHLASIHKALIANEELVHLLSDEQVKQLIAGQKKHVNVQLVKEITTTKRASTKVPKATADDF